MKKPENAKERNLIKGALRRVFSRSELRRQALSRNLIDHTDAERPRVTRWAWCSDCGVIDAAYKMDIDHEIPVIAVNERLEDLTWDEVVSRLWCDAQNLRAVCKDCHKTKTKKEAKDRGLYKKMRKLSK